MRLRAHSPDGKPARRRGDRPAAVLSAWILTLGVAMGNLQACGTAGDTGLLTGVVTRGTGAPVLLPGEQPPPPLPLAGVVVRATPVDIQGPAATARTDATGRYRLALPPGAYRLSLDEIPGNALYKPARDPVVVNPQGETRHDIRVDSRMR